MNLRLYLRLLSIKTVARLPQALYPKVRFQMEKRHGVRYAAQCDLERFHCFGEKLIQSEKRTVKVISKGLYHYDFFNVCFLNDMLSNCLRAICDGYRPRIEILRPDGENVWEDFFEQPFVENENPGESIVVQQGIEKEAIPRWGDIFDPIKVSLYGFLYNNVLVLKKDVSAYVNKEVSELLTNRKVLGVLCRGTDYTMTKPSSHPVQPTENEILNKVEEVFLAKEYEYIYLATEDSIYEDLFRKKFGNCLLVNKRQYYDKIFTENGLHRLKDVHFQRENDLYFKGLEYLSSLIILSKCQGLVAGNCGGTQAAVFWNNGNYKDMYVFDLGLYP